MHAPHTRDGGLSSVVSAYLFEIGGSNLGAVGEDEFLDISLI